MTKQFEQDRPVLDEVQLVRIEAVHRGYLYQHLYAVACILKLSTLETGGVLIERDEDIEFETSDTVFFLQIKTRKHPIQPNDVKDSLEHFKTLRTTHADDVGERRMIFAVVSNQSAGPGLSTQIEHWPEDIVFICPGCPAADYSILPEAPENLTSAITYTRHLAEPLPFQSLQPETLVWKIAARVLMAATGADTDRPTHRFDRSELPALFEAFVEQLQSFPEVIDNYRPQESEPGLISEAPVRILTGFSGAGKTMWAASQAAHTPSVVAYFDIRDLPDTAFSSSLAREIAARFLTGGPGDTARLPYGTGVDVLAALNPQIDTSQGPPVMVLDNIQRCRPEIIRDIIAVCSNVKFVLLSQPGEDIAQHELLLGISVEQLGGWSRETLASVFSNYGIALNPAVARRWHELTGGLPLYVKSAAQICAQSYEGDAIRFLEEIEAGQHAVPVAQEILLKQVINVLSDSECEIIAVLSLAPIPLNLEEIGILTEILANPPTNVTRVLRSLAQTGLVQGFPNNMWKLHDAASVPAQAHVEALGTDIRQACLVSLRDLFLASLMQRQDLVRMAAWMRLLAPTGQANVLSDIAMGEMFHEYGDPADLKSILEDLVADTDETPETHYWALEALASWDLQSDAQHGDPMPRLSRMQEILDAQPDIDADGQLRIDIKTMRWGGVSGNFSIVRDSFARCRRHAADAPAKLRLVRYNYASAVHVLGDNRRALPIAETLYREYYDILGIDVKDVLCATNQQMHDLVGEVDDEKQANLKHLGDCLSLAAKIMRKLSRHPRLLGIHAAKFYMLASAWRSQMKVAQEFADDTLDLGDTQGAVMAMENYVLPLLTHFQFDGEFVEVNSHYAVLLAYAGRILDARRLMAELRPYFDDLPPDHQAGLTRQTEIIEEIARGERAARPRLR